jgi:flavin reductase (DIM6/NTAB) family NADH-FMN oxidoreductase RutF
MSIKTNFPINDTRQLLEPGPIVLVSSAHNGEQNIMTMGWHMMMEYTLVGCYIWDQNYSRRLIEESGECVINIPTEALIEKAIGIGNSHYSNGGEDKFKKFELTPLAAKTVKAPLISECYANIECRLKDRSLIRKYNLFVFEVQHIHISSEVSVPKTFHYMGNGQFRFLNGKVKSYKALFESDRLE